VCMVGVGVADEREGWVVGIGVYLGGMRWEGMESKSKSKSKKPCRVMIQGLLLVLTVRFVPTTQSYESSQQKLNGFFVTTERMGLGRLLRRRT
jgi:hypothetical protein